MAKNRKQSKQRRDVFGELDYQVYQTSLSSSLFPDLKSVRGEYSRLAKAARKRLKRLGEQLPDSYIYETYSGKFNPFAKPLGKNASQKDKDKELAQARKSLQDVAYFLSLKTSTVSGQKSAKKQYVETMRNSGYTWVTEKNAPALGRFLGMVNKYYGSKKSYDSDEYVDLFYELYEENDLTEEELEDYFLEYMEDRGDI